MTLSPRIADADLRRCIHCGLCLEACPTYPLGGREGTAVQMAGALADHLAQLFRLRKEERRILLMSGIADVDVRVAVRTGDTPAYARALMRRRSPHIVVTTPESLYILVTSASGRRMLATTRTIIGLP